MTSLRLQVVTSEHEFAKLGESWQSLAAQDEEATLFNDWQWNSLWWDHYKHLGDLHILLVFNDEQLVGLGPFYRNRSKALGLAKLDTLQFLSAGGDTSPDDLNILVHSPLRQQVTEFLCDYLLGEEFQRIILADVSVSSTFYSTFMNRAKSTTGYSLTPVTHTRRYAELPADWAGFRNQISRNTHKRIKARQNRLDTMNNVAFKICRTPEDVDIAFHALVKLHIARWQTKGHGGSFDSGVYQQFHYALMHELLKRKQLCLIMLEVDNEIIAVEYSFVYKQTLMFFQTGFSPEFEYLSPGHVLMTFAIKQAIQEGVRRIDLLKGDYEYKASYANQVLRSADIGYYTKGMFSFMAKINDQRRVLKQTQQTGSL